MVHALIGNHEAMNLYGDLRYTLPEEFAAFRNSNSEQVRVAFWERGVGVSYASGTGSCGATVAAILNGKTERRVTVYSKAGKLVVEWPENGRLKLTSTASVVASTKIRR